MSENDRYSYDVVVVGAGGSGLRAAIEARLNGKKTAIISKSLFGKAHTVMAEGGCAAAMGNVNPNDNWQVHFRDTMRGGKFLNNWRMAELHAREAPDRVWELEAWGAVFDRTKDGKISQRNFGLTERAGRPTARQSRATPPPCRGSGSAHCHEHDRHLIPSRPDRSRAPRTGLRQARNSIGPLNQ